MATDIQVYKQKNDYMNLYYPELTAEELYSEIFPLDSIEKSGDTSIRASNPIFSFKEKDASGRVYFRNEIVFADHFKESIKKTQGNDLALCSMISYSGRRKTAVNAYKCHGFIIDLDGVGMLELESFWGWVEHLERIPCPTYVANSGHGLHIYYLFENPVPLYPSVVQHLQNLKRGLTLWVWNKETSNYKVKDRQFQGIYQSFRMVGSRTKLGKGRARGKYLVRAWKTGKPVTIEQLNRYVEEPYRCPTNPDYSSWEWADGVHCSLEECKVRYPVWYENRIVKKLPPNQWVCSPNLYYWWLDKMQEDGNAKDGNRYHCISMLFVYAIKSGIPFEAVMEDALSLVEPLNELTMRNDNDFTEEDVIQASSYYSPRFARMTRKEVVRRTGIVIEPCRRNGRTQVEHLFRARAVCNALHDNWRAGNGRPSKKAQIEEWRATNPNGTRRECCEALKFDRKTVKKWWRE